MKKCNNVNVKPGIILALVMMCLMLVACGGQRSWPVEALTADEFSSYADNANVFADSVLESGAKFLYVQLGCAADSGLSDEELAVANDNADGICAMISNDYHDVLDLRNSEEGLTEVIGKKLELSEDTKILVIGDATGESAVYEGLVETYGNIDYLSSVGLGEGDYDEIYERATVAGWDAVIVANDAAAFHEQSFPFGS